jgi:hypothetical protein
MFRRECTVALLSLGYIPLLEMKRQTHDNELIPKIFILSTAMTPSQSQDVNRTQHMIYLTILTSSAKVIKK